MSLGHGISGHLRGRCLGVVRIDASHRVRRRASRSDQDIPNHAQLAPSRRHDAGAGWHVMRRREANRRAEQRDREPELPGPPNRSGCPSIPGHHRFIGTAATNLGFPVVGHEHRQERAHVRSSFRSEPRRAMYREASTARDARRPRRGGVRRGLQWSGRRFVHHATSDHAVGQRDTGFVTRSQRSSVEAVRVPCSACRHRYRSQPSRPHGSRSWPA
jgi:hypothetical protein